MGIFCVSRVKSVRLEKFRKIQSEFHSVNCVSFGKIDDPTRAALCGAVGLRPLYNAPFSRRAQDCEGEARPPAPQSAVTNNDIVDACLVHVKC